MPNITLKNSTYLALGSKAEGNFRSLGKQQLNGDWIVPIEQDMMDRLEEFRLSKEETYDDIVIRAVQHHEPLN